MRQLICPELLEKEPPRIAEEFYSVGRWRVQRATSAERAGATRLVSSWSRWIELPASWARLGEDFTASDSAFTSPFVPTAKVDPQDFTY